MAPLPNIAWNPDGVFYLEIFVSENFT